MRRALAVFVLAACSGAPGDRTIGHHVAPDPVEEIVPERAVYAPRPDLELPADPDPSERVRWPLTQTSHPTLEPAYPIATALAEPGMTYADLCRLGAQKRRTAAGHELGEYLSAWCAVEKRDVDGAVSRLVSLLQAPVAGLPAAARIDIANILVDAGGADQTQRALAKARCDEVEVYDLLAATYLEVGKLGDARLFGNLALDGDDPRQAAKHCQRITRQILLVSESEQAPMIQRLETFLVDPTCAELFHELTCWSGGHCEANYRDRGLDPRVGTLTKIFREWPSGAVHPNDWWAIATDAGLALAVPQADLVTTIALESMLQGLPCAREEVGWVTRAAKDAMAHKHDPALDSRLDVLSSHPETLCVH